jgi:phenylalanyl-tRNA synthetase beta chain
VVSYSFIDPNLSALVCPQDAAIPLQNPISEEMSLMRTSILPALLSTLSYNENRQQERIRLFESGLVFFLEAADIRQVAMISGLISGYKYPKIWNNNKETCNYYDIKGDVEVLLGLGGNIDAFSFIPAQYGCFHPGQCARVDYDGEPIGHIGALHPAIARKLDLKTAPFLFELQLDAVKSAILPSVQTLSRYPEVSRDLAIVIADSVSADAILALIRDEGGEFLTNLRIFDVYQGDAVTKGKKSIALGLTWQHPSRTLSDEDINTIIGSCVNALYDKFNAKLRS